jgi:citronellyl-CoA dehydrogenase
MGFTYQMMQFQQERLAAAALSLAPMDRLIEDTIEYCRERKAFGRPLLDNQYIHYRLAELKTDVELLRAGVYSATDNFVAGNDVTEMASMIKLKVYRLLPKDSTYVRTFVNVIVMFLF